MNLNDVIEWAVIIVLILLFSTLILACKKTPERELIDDHELTKERIIQLNIDMLKTKPKIETYTVKQCDDCGGYGTKIGESPSGDITIVNCKCGGE